MIDRLDPRGEQRVELEQRRGRGESSLGQLFGGGVGDLDEELLAHATKPPLDLAAALRAVRGGVDQPDAELAAGPQQPGVDVGAAVVDVDAGRDTPRGEGGLQRGGQAHRVLGEPEPVPDGQPAVIVEEGEQVGLAAANVRAVQRVTDPAGVRAAASNRPNTAGWSPAAGPIRSRRWNSRSSVDSEGDQPPEARRIRTTCAAVRSGFSCLSAAASSSTVVSMRLPGWRVDGASASSPPVR